jgi:chlorobactene glucosyltransferase
MAELLLWLLFAVLALLTGVACWNVVAWLRPGPATGSANPQITVSVLIPARNEEENIRDCLQQVLQQGSVVSEVLVLDDSSTDRTAEIAAEMSRADPRIRLLRGTDLPVGWTGKCWACQQLGEAATGQWLLFLDADARITKGALPAILSTVDQQNCTLLSCWPGLVMRSFWELLLMPLLNFLTFTIYPAPLAYLRPQDASLGLAHGACILVERCEYNQFGGHTGVRGELFEDTKLARYWRRSGRRSCCVDGSRLVQVRMYSSLGQIWVGFEKNFFAAFRNTLGFIVFLVSHLVLFFLPFVLLTAAAIRYGTAGIAVPLVLCCLLVLLIRLLLSHRFNHPFWSVLLHPVAELLLAAIAVNSWWRMTSGRGVRWKDRNYGGSAASGLKEVGK